jgi:hypothetical protein
MSRKPSCSEGVGGKSMGLLRTALSRSVVSKAEMYGFPLIVWSSGSLQAHRFGSPGIVEVVAYVCGALAAMMLVVALACGGLTGPLPQRDLSVRAFGAVHVLSVLGSVVAVWAVALITRGFLAFFLASFATILVFEVLLSIELHTAAGRSPKETPGAEN